MCTLNGSTLREWCVVGVTVLCLGPGVAVAGERAPVEAVFEIGEQVDLTSYPAISPDDGLVNVFIECPTGTTARLALEEDGLFHHREADGKPIFMRYLPFPANYGQIPNTFIPVDIGGEGEGLDIQVLGEALPPGSVLKVRVIGALALLDRGSQDDKLVAVIPGSAYDAVHDIKDLDREFPGATRILETWWTNFKGQQVTVSRGFVGAAAAMRLIHAAIHEFEKRQQTN